MDVTLWRERIVFFNKSIPLKFLNCTELMLGFAMGTYLLWAGVFWRNVNCDQPLATWLWVSGLNAYVVILILFVLTAYTLWDEGVGSSGNKFVGFLLFCIVLVGVYSLIWFFIGNGWTLASHTCYQTLKDTAYWYLVFFWVVLLLNIFTYCTACCVCRKPPN